MELQDKLKKIIETLKEYKLSMEETMELIQFLAVDEFETPRVQAAIDARNENMASLLLKLLSYYKPEVALYLLSDVALKIIEQNKGIMQILEKDISATKQNYIK